MPTTKLIFFLFLVLCTPFDAAGGLEVSLSEIVASLNKVGGFLHDVTSTLKFVSSNANGGFDDFRLSDAISVCLDLLDLSIDELSWSVSAVETPQGNNYSSTGNLSADLRAWLSAALANTETCMDELESANGKLVKGLISKGIRKVNSLIKKLLTQVQHIVWNNSQLGQFPPWADPIIFDVVIAADGTGTFTTVMDAVHAAPDYSLKRHVIYIKRGVYFENVEINKKKWNLVMIGEGMDATVISGNLSRTKKLTTFKTATFGVKGKGFIARDMSFQNTAGPENHQAVALRSLSDLSVFYRCGIYGYQDTLYAHSLRQFYRECKITGTVDFIFGHATAVFQNCQILVKKGLPKQKNTITAQGQKDPAEPSGFSIQFCNISADSDLLPQVNTTQTYLGRPWKPYSRTVFMQSYISDVLQPEGWLEWNGSEYLDTLYYAEYKNYGPGAGLQNRVKWPGYHVMNDANEASNFTVTQLILGDLWLPSTGVRFTPGFGDQSIA